MVGADDYTERTKESWRWYEINQACLSPAPIDQSERARNIREINRISTARGWGIAVEAALDRASVTGLNELDDSQLCDLVDEMRALVDCAETGACPSSLFPAY